MYLAKRQLNNVEKRTEELKELQLEARNHLYAFFKDTEAWKEASQSTEPYAYLVRPCADSTRLEELTARGEIKESKPDSIEVGTKRQANPHQLISLLLNN